MRFSGALAGAVLIAACAPGSSKTSSTELDDPLAIAAQVARHEVRQAEFWSETWRLPLSERIRHAPLSLLDFIKKDSFLGGVYCDPTSAQHEDKLEPELRGAIKSIPKIVHDLAAPRIAAIVLVKGLGSLGYSFPVASGRIPHAGSVIVLDEDLLDQPVNEAFAWREKLALRPAPSIDVQVTLEHGGENNTRNAFRHVLLHEFAHAIAGHRPDPADPSFGAYYKTGWEWHRDRYISRYEFFVKNPVRSYARGAATAEGRPVATVYAELMRTDYATLYSATSPAEDLAEGFATFVHTVLDGRPYSVRVNENGREIANFGSCWGQARCARKEQLLRDAFFGSEE
jgi:hypothetical protein